MDNVPAMSTGLSTGASGAAVTSAVDQVGARVRHARLERRMGLRELARAVDCSASLISQIERGTAKPSVSTLYAISTALGISTDVLIAGAPYEEEPRSALVSSARPSNGNGRRSIAVVLRRQDRRVINLERGVRWELLTPIVDPTAEFMEVTYAPNGGSSADEHAIRHNGREHCLILEGVLSVEIGFESYTLETGDSMAFDSTIPHRLWNEGQVSVRAIWFVLDRVPG